VRRRRLAERRPQTSGLRVQASDLGPQTSDLGPQTSAKTKAKTRDNGLWTDILPSPALAVAVLFIVLRPLPFLRPDA
jgi:hypothetical protein